MKDILKLIFGTPLYFIVITLQACGLTLLCGWVIFCFLQSVMLVLWVLYYALSLIIGIDPPSYDPWIWTIDK